MKKLLKNSTAVLMAAIMMLSVILAAPLSVSAATTEKSTTGESYNEIYFDVESSGWQDVNKIYCHISKTDGTGDWPYWQTSAEQCTDNGDGTWSYDLSKTGNDIKRSDGKIYYVIFSSDTGLQTYTLIMSGSCIGDTAYCTGETCENPEFPERISLIAAWRNNPDCGAAKKITSTGNVVGSAFPDGENNVTLLAQYLVYYYGDPARLETSLLQNLFDTLNVSVSDVMASVRYKVDDSPDKDIIISCIEDALKYINDPTKDDSSGLSDPTSDEFEYELLDDGTAEITGYNGEATVLEIPGEIEGYTVTSIGYSAFRDCTSLTSITIPDGVTSIYACTFQGCTSLKSVTIPDSVTSIRSCAFSGCTSLANITIPESVTLIAEGAFECCTSLKSITIPENVRSIYYGAFCGCTSLETVNYNAVNCKDEFGTFSGCTALTTLNIGKKVLIIPQYLFSGCTSLDNISIPDSVTSIGKRAFDDTAWYNNQPDGLIYLDGWAYGYKGEMPKNTSIILKDGTKGIVNSAFAGSDGPGEQNTNLVSVTIPDSVKSIGSDTFSYCTSLESITIPDSVTSIGQNAFHGCTSLVSITIPDSVTSVGGWAFFNTAWYDKQPDGVVYAGKVAYKYKGEMPENTSIELKDDTTGIAGVAFDECTNLTSIKIPDGVTSIGLDAFSECTGLTSITIPDSVTIIDDFAFAGCKGFDSIEIPDSVIVIGYGAFWNCTGIENITIPYSVNYIDDYAFGYYDGSDYYTKNESFTIYGYSGTAAETYANENGFEFIALAEQEVTFGDANGDGEINAKDRMMLTRHLAKWTGYEDIDKSAADVNADGEVNAKDRMILTRHLAKWQGYETLPFDKN